MKLTIGLFVVMLIITSSLSLPAGSPNDDSEILNTTNISENSSQDDIDTNFNNFQGVVDTGVGDPYYSYTVNPLSFLDYFQDTLRIIREGIERKLWTQGGLEAEQGDSSIDESKRNSTSVVEVIDGHKIEINETVYANNNDGHAIFKVRVIQVRPLDLDDNLTSEVTSVVNESKFEIENNADNDIKQTVDNEINKSVISPEIIKLHQNTSNLTIYSTTTTFPYMTSSENADIDEAHLLDVDDFLNETNSTNILDTTEEYQNFQNTESQTSLFDQDEYVVESTSTENVMTIITTNIPSEYTRESSESESNEHQQKNDNVNSEWETLENDSSNELNNDFEMYSPVEIDLSNDIFINDVLSEQGVTQHPEAEIFSDVVINYNPNNNSQTYKIITLADSIIIPSVQTNFSSTNIK